MIINFKLNSRLLSMNTEKKLKIKVITIFPEVFPGPLNVSILKKNYGKSFILEIIDLRKYDKRIDDTPYGGGGGMVFKFDPLYRCIKDNLESNTKVISMTPIGYRLNTTIIENINYENIIIITSRFLGIDARILEVFNVLPISIGDFVLCGGETPALVFIEALVRYKLDILGNKDSTNNESFVDKRLLGYPRYTKPKSIVIEEGTFNVPDILLSGNRALIKKYNEKISKDLTCLYNPNLLNN